MRNILTTFRNSRALKLAESYGQDSDELGMNH